MSKFRRAARVDENQSDLVKALRRIPGVTVEVGHDDILVGHKEETYWFEVKRQDEVRRDGTLKARALKNSQKRLSREWSGHYRVVWSLEQILEDIGL